MPHWKKWMNKGHRHFTVNAYITVGGRKTDTLVCPHMLDRRGRLSYEAFEGAAAT